MGRVEWKWTGMELEWNGMEWNSEVTKHVRVPSGEMEQSATAAVQATCLCPSHPSAVPLSIDQTEVWCMECGKREASQHIAAAGPAGEAGGFLHTHITPPVHSDIDSSTLLCTTRDRITAAVAASCCDRTALVAAAILPYPDVEFAVAARLSIDLRPFPTRAIVVLPENCPLCCHGMTGEPVSLRSDPWHWLVCTYIKKRRAAPPPQCRGGHHRTRGEAGGSAGSEGGGRA